MSFPYRVIPESVDAFAFERVSVGIGSILTLATHRPSTNIAAQYAMLRVEGVSETQYEVGMVPAQAQADATSVHPLLTFVEASKLLQVTINSASAVTGTAGDYRNVNLRKNGSEIGNIDFSLGTNHAANVADTLYTNGTGGLACAAGATLDIQSELVAGGLAHPAWSVLISFTVDSAGTGNVIRFRLDGTTPTATIGTQLSQASAQTLVLSGPEIAAFKATRDATSTDDPVLTVHYFR